MTKVTEAEVWADLYHPVEHKILAEYMDWDPMVPVDDVGIYDGAGEDTEYICVEEDAWGDHSDISLANAVARIALETADDQPVDWDEMYEEEYAEFHQRIRSKTVRPVTLSPRNLFSISWATGGPCCWYETYHVTFILGYRHQVVTVTRDSVDHFGYCQEAIGFYPGEGLDLLDSTGRIIREYWRTRFSEDGSPWTNFDDAGLINRDTAEQWAVLAWGECVEFAPDWYRDRVDRGDEGKSRTVRDKKRRGQFIRLINDDVPFQDMPDEVRRLFLQPW